MGKRNVLESGSEQKLTQLMIPSLGSLFEAIDGFMKFSNIWGLIKVNKTWWLSHKYIFREPALKKHIIDIQLAKRPTITYCYTKHKSHCGRLDNWTESFMVVHTRSLMKAFGYKASFVPVNGTIRVSFNTENLFATNQISNVFRWN